MAASPPWVRHARRATQSGPGSLAPIGSRVRPPRPSPRLLPRPRLVDRVSLSLRDASLVLISAPAGYGKTTLAAAWARLQPACRPAAWVSLTERDAQPKVFWSHVLLAAAFVGSVAAEAPHAVFWDDYDLDEVGELLLAAGPLVLVLDAVERLGGSPVLRELAHLLEGADGRLRVVMTARGDPALPLPRYRLDGSVAELRYGDLAMTDTEALAVLDRHGVAGAGPGIPEALATVDGWPAGVRMVALDAQSAHRPEQLEDSAADYLQSEVLDGLSQTELDLLLEVSVVRVLPPGLAPALTGRADSDDELKRMSAQNAFVQPLAEEPGYRLHPLVRRVLETRLAHQRPEVAAKRRGQGAAWLDDRGTRLLQDGDLDAARAVLADACRLAEQADGGDPSARRTRSALALALACRGELSASTAMVARDAMVARGQQTGHLPMAGQLARAWVAVERQELGPARDALVAAARESCDDELHVGVLLLLRARLARDHGDVVRARQLLAQFPSPAGWLEPAAAAEAAAVGLARPSDRGRHVATGCLADQVLLLLDRAHAVVSFDQKAAVALLAEAVSMAESELLRRPFAHLTPALRGLLRDAPTLRSRVGWLRPEPAQRGERAEQYHPAALPIELSRRELEVLSLLGAMMTTDEIAAQLFISVNTVRTHVRKILQKLGVSRRYEAVRRARELGLL